MHGGVEGVGRTMGGMGLLWLSLSSRSRSEARRSSNVSARAAEPMPLAGIKDVLRLTNPPAPHIRSLHAAPMPDWPRALRVYLVTIALGDLAWEAAHLPLYTIWRTGTPGEKAFAVVHCTGGDLLIALACLALALVLAGKPAWPVRTHRRVAVLTTGFGVAYTVFSEWLNIVVREAWAYSDLMPVVPVIDTGLSPLLQWVVVPWLALHLARRAARAHGKEQT